MTKEQNEDIMLRTSICWQCAESALHSVIGDLSHTYFVGNAPMGHMVIQPTDNKDASSFKVCQQS